MSVILEALKKLDREKSSRHNGTANIAVEILRSDLPRSGKRIPLYFVIVTLSAVAAAAITYAVVGFLNPRSMSRESAPSPLRSAKSSSPEPIPSPPSHQPDRPAPLNSGSPAKSSPPPSVNPPATNQQVAPDAPNPAKVSPPADANPPALSQQVAPAPLSREQGHGARNETGPVPQSIENQTESKTPATSLGEKEAGQKAILEKANVAPGKMEPPAEQTPVRPAATPPSLKLSAIVWHEEPSKRIAMVNGTLATEGSVIEGVKVEEIYPNRVRFSHNDRPFEIMLK